MPMRLVRERNFGVGELPVVQKRFSIGVVPFGLKFLRVTLGIQGTLLN